MPQIDLPDNCACSSEAMEQLHSYHKAKLSFNVYRRKSVPNRQLRKEFSAWKRIEIFRRRSAQQTTPERVQRMKVNQQLQPTRSQTNSQLVLLWRRKQSAVRANVISTYFLVWFWFCFCSGLAERLAENVVKLASTNKKKNALQTQNQSNHMITFDSHLKTAAYGNCNKHTAVIIPIIN